MPATFSHLFLFDDMIDEQQRQAVWKQWLRNYAFTHAGDVSALVNAFFRFRHLLCVNCKRMVATNNRKHYTEINNGRRVVTCPSCGARADRSRQENFLRTSRENIQEIRLEAEMNAAQHQREAAASGINYTAPLSDYIEYFGDAPFVPVNLFLGSATSTPEQLHSHFGAVSTEFGESKFFLHGSSSRRQSVSRSRAESKADSTAGSHFDDHDQHTRTPMSTGSAVVLREGCSSTCFRNCLNPVTEASFHDGWASFLEMCRVVNDLTNSSAVKSTGRGQAVFAKLSAASLRIPACFVLAGSTGGGHIKDALTTGTVIPLLNARDSTSSSRSAPSGASHKPVGVNVSSSNLPYLCKLEREQQGNAAVGNVIKTLLGTMKQNIDEDSEEAVVPLLDYCRTHGEMEMLSCLTRTNGLGGSKTYSSNKDVADQGQRALFQKRIEDTVAAFTAVAQQGKNPPEGTAELMRGISAQSDSSFLRYFGTAYSWNEERSVLKNSGVSDLSRTEEHRLLFWAWFQILAHQIRSSDRIDTGAKKALTSQDFDEIAEKHIPSLMDNFQSKSKFASVLRLLAALGYVVAQHRHKDLDLVTVAAMADLTQKTTLAIDEVAEGHFEGGVPAAVNGTGSSSSPPSGFEDDGDGPVLQAVSAASIPEEIGLLQAKTGASVSSGSANKKPTKTSRTTAVAVERWLELLLLEFSGTKGNSILLDGADVLENNNKAAPEQQVAQGKIRQYLRRLLAGDFETADDEDLGMAPGEAGPAAGGTTQTAIEALKANLAKTQAADKELTFLPTDRQRPPVERNCVLRFLETAKISTASTKPEDAELNAAYLEFAGSSLDALDAGGRMGGSTNKGTRGPAGGVMTSTKVPAASSGATPSQQLQTIFANLERRARASLADCWGSWHVLSSLASFPAGLVGAELSSQTWTAIADCLRKKPGLFLDRGSVPTTTRTQESAAGDGGREDIFASPTSTACGSDEDSSSDDDAQDETTKQIFCDALEENLSVTGFKLSPEELEFVDIVRGSNSMLRDVDAKVNSDIPTGTCRNKRSSLVATRGRGLHVEHWTVAPPVAKEQRRRILERLIQNIPVEKMNKPSASKTRTPDDLAALFFDPTGTAGSVTMTSPRSSAGSQGVRILTLIVEQYYATAENFALLALSRLLEETQTVSVEKLVKLLHQVTAEVNKTSAAIEQVSSTSLSSCPSSPSVSADAKRRFIVSTWHLLFQLLEETRKVVDAKRKNEEPFKVVWEVVTHEKSVGVHEHIDETLSGAASETEPDASVCPVVGAPDESEDQQDEKSGAVAARERTKNPNEQPSPGKQVNTTRQSTEKCLSEDATGIRISITRGMLDTFFVSFVSELSSELSQATANSDEQEVNSFVNALYLQSEMQGPMSSVVAECKRRSLVTMAGGDSVLHQSSQRITSQAGRLATSTKARNAARPAAQLALLKTLARHQDKVCSVVADRNGPSRVPSPEQSKAFFEKVICELGNRALGTSWNGDDDEDADAAPPVLVYDLAEALAERFGLVKRFLDHQTKHQALQGADPVADPLFESLTAITSNIRLKLLLDDYLQQLLPSAFFVTELIRFRKRRAWKQSWKVIDSFYGKHLFTTVFLPQQIEKAKVLLKHQDDWQASKPKLPDNSDEEVKESEISMKFLLRKSAKSITVNLSNEDDVTAQLTFQLVDNYPLGPLVVQQGGNSASSPSPASNQHQKNTKSGTTSTSGGGAAVDLSASSQPAWQLIAESALSASGPMAAESGIMGVPMAKFRKWELASRACENISFPDLIIQWRGNFVSHFQGWEDCMICYSVVHVQFNTLPRSQCPTCKNKFHKACLSKWFQSSGKSTCPLCKQPF
ncbi:unnamed protein product [Amoebophrya sp. A120]|nr:unnamed protein product [Amoebophrya sp. A120]|eukprot:GSA120T00006337001.1